MELVYLLHVAKDDLVSALDSRRHEVIRVLHLVQVTLKQAGSFVRTHLIQVKLKQAGSFVRTHLVQVTLKQVGSFVRTHLIQEIGRASCRERVCLGV